MKIRVKGQEFEVGTDDGTRLRTSVDGFEVTAHTLVELSANVNKVITRPKVNIPVMRLTAPGSWKNKTGKFTYNTGKLTGIHAGNGNMLVHWDGQKAGEQAYGNEVYEPFTEDEKAKLQRLWEAQEKATREYEKFHQSKRILEEDARELVAKAAKAMTKGKQ